MSMQLHTQIILGFSSYSHSPPQNSPQVQNVELLKWAFRVQTVHELSIKSLSLPSKHF